MPVLIILVKRKLWRVTSLRECDLEIEMQLPGDMPLQDDEVWYV